MKASTNMSPEELDLLFFEYLEGELTDGEARAFEQQLAADPGLQQELESWQESYVGQEFYDTALLEEHLMTAQPGVELSTELSAGSGAAKFTFSTYLNTVVFASMTTLLSFMLITDESREGLAVLPEIKAPVAMEEVVEAQTSETEETLIIANEAPEETGSSAAAAAAVDEVAYEEIEYKGNEAEEVELAAGYDRQLSITVPERYPLDLGLRQGDALISQIAVKKVRMPKKMGTPNISRSQQRMIQKHKDKAMQDRMAREFMKGNIPYVVPLNSKNF